MIEPGKVAVIIPFYKHNLSDYEEIALRQCFKVLADYPIIAVKPYSLTLPHSVASYPFLDTVIFDDEYFKSIRGYNRLMLSSEFYGQFLLYEYILIYQLDAFVFNNELNYWCNQNWDYIGAPWIKPHPAPDIFKWIKNSIKYYRHTRNNVYKNGEPSDYQFAYKVGNGGFSLRRTSKFYEICKSHQELIAKYQIQTSNFFNEDVFWSVEVNRKRKILNIPNYKKALKFSIEFCPEQALILNKNELPFGCHAWDLNVDFWRPVFKTKGYDL